MTGFVATVALKKLASRELDASVGASGPHDFAVRVGAVRQKRRRVHRISPHVRDDREPPLLSGEMGRIDSADLPDGLSGIYFPRGLDSLNVNDVEMICPPGNRLVIRAHTRATRARAHYLSLIGAAGSMSAMSPIATKSCSAGKCRDGPEGDITQSRS